jgi:hypothetical protein
VAGLIDWYWLGVLLGLGVAGGGALVGLARAPGRALAVVAFSAAAAVAVLIAYTALPLWTLAAFVVGSWVGRFSLRRLSAAALPAAVMALAALAFIPLLGYLEGVLAPVLGQRLSRRAGSRYAGLRVLAKD